MEKITNLDHCYYLLNIYLKHANDPLLHMGSFLSIVLTVKLTCCVMYKIRGFKWILNAL